MIRRREFIGERADGEPEDEADHFMACPMCGKWFDCRDLGDALAHVGPPPHDAPETH